MIARKNDFAEISKNLAINLKNLDTDLKIILLLSKIIM